MTKAHLTASNASRSDAFPKRSVAFTALHGALLIGLAVVVGIVLLQVVDDGSSSPAKSGQDQGESDVDDESRQRAPPRLPPTTGCPTQGP